MLIESSYSSSLNDSQWELIKDEFTAPKRRGRPPKYSKRHIVDAILYVTRTGCQWRDLPKDFPHWNSCFQYFNKWSAEGLWLKIHTKLVEEIRVKAGKKTAPTAAIIDSQSVKTAMQKGIRGYDAGKKIKGRKRHILVDTMGNILLLDVHSAAIQDRDGGAELLKQLDGCYGWLKRIWADGGYSGRLADVLLELDRHRKIVLEVVKRREEEGFHILPKRWIVERTFAWFLAYRRLSKDYEVKTENSKSMIYLGMIRRMLKNLTK